MSDVARSPKVISAEDKKQRTNAIIEFVNWYMAMLRKYPLPTKVIRTSSFIDILDDHIFHSLCHCEFDFAKVYSKVSQD
jgi:hypothetical protein